VVYLAKDLSGWKFLGPEDGATYFDEDAYPTPEEAMEAADAHFGVGK
jgi:hypothetical protein